MKTFTRDDETGDWRKLHNDKLRKLKSSHATVTKIKSRKIRWAEHVAFMA